MARNGGVKRIETTERLPNSRMGNPRWRVTFTDGTVAITTSDASISYAINNPEYRNNDVRVWLTEAGRISDLTIARPGA